AGNDILDGGAGNDTLDGGAGNDIFIYNILSNIDSLYGNGEDSINNFKLGEDLIDLTALFVEYKDREDFDLNDFIRVESTITSNRSTIYLDRDGKNNDYTSTKFIELNSNMKNLSVEDLFNNVIII
ncbi:type I secretion C-terminal target domain-containing protein, partial [Acinetobacter haemolyticus]